MLSWFGAVRMKRKPLKYEEQRWLVQFHNHQDHFHEMMYNPHYVSLPEVATPAAIMDDGVKSEEDGTLTDVPKENAGQVSSASTAVTTPSTSVSTLGVGMASQQPSNQTQVGSAVRPPPSATVPSQAAQQGQFTLNPGMAQRAPLVHMIAGGRSMPRAILGSSGVPMSRMMQPGSGAAGLALNRPDVTQRMRLEQIRAANLHQQQIRSVSYPPAPGGVVMTNAYRPQMSAMNPVGVGHDTSQLNMMYQRHHQMQHRRMMAVQLQRQQQLRRHQAAMMAQATGYPQQQQYSMRPTPMQANPPMPMQQVMQPQYVQQAPGGMMMRAPRPPGQLTYQPGMNPTMPQQPPMYR